MRRVLPLLMFCVTLPLGQARAQSRPSAEKTAEEKTAEAAEAFARATRAFESQDYVTAIREFERAHALKPHFMVRCSIARAHELLGQFVKAAEHYRACLEEGAGTAPNADQVRESVKDVEARIAWLVVESPGKGGEIFVDGRSAGNAPSRVPVDPGPHVVEVRRTGATPATADVDAVGGQELKLALSPVDPAPPKPAAPPAPQPPETRRRVSPTWFWVAAGGTALLGTVAVVLGAQTLSARSDYNEDPTKERLDTFDTMRNATNAMWALTAVAASGTTVLFFYTDFAGERRDTGRTALVGLQGTF